MKIYYKFLLLLLPFLGKSQELPPVINFNPNQYEAGNQNWRISQGGDKNLYIANGTGLLEYTGENWSLYPMPNNTVVRSVNVVEDYIFTGAYMEIGYWKKNNYGSLDYTSLIPHFPGPVQDGEQFWHIENLGNFVVFQSFEGLYVYEIGRDEVRKINIYRSNPVTNLFKVENSIYFQVAEEGLFLIRNESAQEVIEEGVLQGKEIMHVFRENGILNFITGVGEFYRWNGIDLVQYNLQVSEKLRGLSIFTALNLSDGSVFIGTVEKGIYQVNPEGEIVYHYNQEKGLVNNTVLSLFLDEDENLWAGLDNGLSIINIKSPFKLFQDNYGTIGSVYTSLKKGDFLYLGTNQGLYFRKNGEVEFQLVEGTNGQVWSLEEIDGFLFCGHNRGTFLVNKGVASKVADRFGTWIVKQYNANPDYYIQGHYNGISFLKREGETVREIPMVNGFPHSSKFIVTEEDGDIWIGNEHKGVFRLRIDENFSTISETENFEFENLPGINSSMFRFNDTLYFSAKEKILQYQEKENRFSEENKLNDLIKDYNRISGRLINDGDSRLWGFTKNSVFSVEVGQLSPGYRVSSTYLPSDLRNIALGYENISLSSPNLYLLGVANGYLIFDMTRYRNNKNEIRFDNIYKSALDEAVLPVNLEGEDPFHYKINNISFNFSIPEYRKFLTPLYSYRLIGQSEQWTDWRMEPVANFKNLPYGPYHFEVRGKAGDEITPVISYSFEIARPWYLSNLAFFVYVLLFFILIYLVHRTYVRQHQKIVEENEKTLRMKNLEAEQKIIKLQNEQLERDMASKNKELAVSTMSLIKKNEFLTSIKKHLKVTGDSNEVKSVIKKIDKDISEEDNWKFFKEAFNNADKDFFKKIKARHPQLTSNDLKLCAYLRLNLSSKEIAPLLNISVKSVEIKRYRLRKKMDLPRERQLTDYILEI